MLQHEKFYGFKNLELNGLFMVIQSISTVGHYKEEEESYRGPQDYWE